MSCNIYVHNILNYIRMCVLYLAYVYVRMYVDTYLNYIRTYVYVYIPDVHMYHAYISTNIRMYVCTYVCMYVRIRPVR